MADEGQVIHGINWRETFPFTNLFRSFRIAIHPSKLVLALGLLLLLYLGGRVLDAIWPDKYSATPGAVQIYEQSVWGGNAAAARAMRRFPGMGAAPWMRDIDGIALPDFTGFAAAQEAREAQVPRVGIFISFFEYEIAQVNNVSSSVLAGNWLGAMGGTGVLPSVANFLVVGPGWLFTQHPLYGVLYALWFLAVWAILGGAIARIAAVHAARDEKLSVQQALRFSTGKFLSFAFAPIIPLLIALALGMVLAAGGQLLRIPVVGPILVGLLFFLALIAGFIMTLVLLGTAGGFNLMYPTVAVEGSDSFDAISRSFSYVYARPWRMLFYTAVALFYGALCYLFVRLFIFLVLVMTNYFVGWWLNGQPAAYWNGNVQSPPTAVVWDMPTFTNLTHHVDHAHLKWSEDIAAWLVAVWVYLTVALLGAFAISFYFSANTIIYYLMRQEVDATEMDDVYLEQAEEEFAEPAPAAPVTSPTAPASTMAPAVEPAAPAPTVTADASPAAVVEPPKPIEPPADKPAT